ncbi:unnamed protein product [Kuraishia capsulata CBS 1993]|uniref:CTLH domain-containing protein n=1 Tax=Kuraishia capsulata CBS 1993 TaxID=1382522 RepID=W6MFZ9_9ASCO|nr:uncharacterized protein KUCA_T00000567001 [Kuraishia capsulata CBS 1993]CDK24601.1 unnamed protein product [Kuraishia capsulata CBS 1993]
MSTYIKSSFPYNRTGMGDTLETNRINHLILNYLIVEGYENATLKFGKELGFDFIEQFLDSDRVVAATGVEPASQDEDLDIQAEADRLFSKENITNRLKDLERDLPETGLSRDALGRLTLGLSTIKTRNRIRSNILGGRIAETIVLINEHFPTLFEKNQFIYFKLLHLNLIEMIRSHHKDPAHSTEDEKVFLDEILRFIKEKLSTVKILQNKTFIKELELTMALLCFSDQMGRDSAPVRMPQKLRALFDLKLRKEVGTLVNKSILINLNNEDINNLVLVGNEPYVAEMDRKLRPKGTNLPRGESQDNLLMKFNDIENVKLKSLMKLWIWATSESDIDWAKKA